MGNMIPFSFKENDAYKTVIFLLQIMIPGTSNCS